MGFKRIETFNDTLLAKQVWRMIHNLESLCFKVFKAKFFLDCSILKDKESTEGSYAWKSIIKGREVIKRGASWRIGTGAAIDIWGSNWLPT